MIHPVFRLAAAQPMLLATHVGAYAGLVSEELHTSAAALQRRLLWQLGGALCLTVAAVLAGVALLLWAALPPGGAARQWLFVATPLLPAALGLAACWRAQVHRQGEPLARLRAQLMEDAAVLARYAAP
jgi:uncharacterized membrane protein YqjE